MGYFCAIMLLTLLTVVTGSTALLCLCIFVLFLPGVSLLAGVYVRKSISGRIDLPATASKETAISGILTLNHKSWLPAPGLCCFLSIKNELTGETSMLELPMALGANGTDSREFLLESAHCGGLYVHLCKVRLMDYFGLFSIKVPIRVSSRMTVLPELLPSEVALSSSAADFADDAAARRGDDRTEIFQLREYQSGDDIRQIHWKLSSKVDSLLLKEPGESISNSLLVLWDKRHPCTPNKMDAMAEVAASVCHGLSQSGVMFDLCWTEGEELELRQIHDGDALLQSIPELVKRAGTPACATPAFEAYSRVIYIAASLPEGEQSEKVTFLLCADEDAPRCICFSPQDHGRVLERLEL